MIVGLHIMCHTVWDSMYMVNSYQRTKFIHHHVVVMAET